MRKTPTGSLIFSHHLERDDVFLERLQSHGYEVRYVIAPDKRSEALSSFLGKNPSVVVHELYDLRRSVFPKAIADLIEQSGTVIDDALLKKFEPHLFNLMGMCSRIDGDGFSFSFEQRWSLIKDLIVAWKTVLSKLEIGMVVINHVPHFPSEYILYVLCQLSGIPTLMRTEISGTRDVYYATSIEQKHLPIEAMAATLARGASSPENDQYFARLRATYDQAMPWDIKEQKESKKKHRDLVFLLKILKVKIPRVAKKLFRNTRMTVKANRLPLRNPRSGLNYLQLVLYFRKARRLILANKRIYESLLSSPDYTKPYVLFASHYQPERTTCPDAGYYGDLLLVIDLIAKSLPSGWTLYYKEHPTSFLPPNSDLFLRGHLFRSREYFEKIASYPNVKLVDVGIDSFQLIDSAAAVATPTGTSAWEAVVRGKVGIIFGNCWFSACPGITLAKDQSDLQKAFSATKKDTDIEGAVRYRQAFLELAKGCPIARKAELESEDYARSYADFVDSSVRRLRELKLIRAE